MNAERPQPPASRDHDLTAALEQWFLVTRRTLPWRPPYRLPRDPYHAMVSEFMLQQTQVSRVLEYFPRFIAAWPNVAALAAAPVDDVLAAWSGLGYYRRARNLHAAARAVARDHAGQVPADVSALRALPGIGPYTAGAIASIVFGRPEPAVDGNVTRVLLRVEGRRTPPTDPKTVRWTWARATDLARAAGDPGLWNEGLMDLGATVCLPPPARPRCDVCPLRAHCRAFARGLQDRIPAPKPAPASRDVHAACAVVLRGEGPARKVLLEQRAHPGLWHGLWTPPMLMPARTGASTAALARALRVRGLRLVGTLERATSAARVRFGVYAASAVGTGGGKAGTGERRWVRLDALGSVGLSSAHRRIVEMVLGAGDAEGAPRQPQRGAAAARAIKSATRRAR